MVGNSGSSGVAGAFGEPGPQGWRRCPAVSGVIRSLRPLPWQATWRRRRGGHRAQVRPVSSETRRPVWTASSSRAWSRRPVRVDRSGAASSASISASVRKRDDRLVEALGRDRQDPFDVGGVLGVAQRGEAEQGVDRGQPGVAGADAVAALASRGGRGTRRSAARPGRRGRAGRAACRCCSCGEAQQQPEGVAVGGDRVRAGLALADQPLGEERLQGAAASAVTGRRSPVRVEPLRAATASSSGDGAAGTSRCAPGRRGRGRSTAAAAGRHVGAVAVPVRAGWRPRRCACNGEFPISAIRWTAGLCALPGGCAW